MTMTKLSEFAYFVSTKINVKELTRSNYIGVDNMLQNKNGIMQSEYLSDNGYAIAFKENDILIGNIRPYLKKIWLATFDGGCSQDVLCLRCHNSRLSGFIFSLLSQDCFFDYVMKGSKGTRMARGDKKHILNYKFCDVSNKEQIGQLITNLNKKIFLNNKINDNLSQLIDIIFKHYFLIDIKNQKGDFESILDHYDAYQPETISNTSFNNNFPYSVYGGGGLIGKYSKFNHDQPQVIISCRGSCGNTYFTSPYSWITGNAMVIKPKSDVLSKEYIFSYLKNIGVDKYLSGSVQKQLTKENLKNMEIYVPKYNDCLIFTTTVREYHEKIFKIREENEKLVKIRDFLLPLLLNGQIIIR